MVEPVIDLGTFGGSSGAVMHPDDDGLGPPVDGLVLLDPDGAAAQCPTCHRRIRVTAFGRLAEHYSLATSKPCAGGSVEVQAVEPAPVEPPEPEPPEPEPPEPASKHRRDVAADVPAEDRQLPFALVDVAYAAAEDALCGYATDAHRYVRLTATRAAEKAVTAALKAMLAVELLREEWGTRAQDGTEHWWGWSQVMCRQWVASYEGTVLLRVYRTPAEVVYGPGPPGFTCPRCSRTWYESRAVDEGWCGACTDWTRVTDGEGGMRATSDEPTLPAGMGGVETGPGPASGSNE